MNHPVNRAGRKILVKYSFANGAGLSEALAAIKPLSETISSHPSLEDAKQWASSWLKIAKSEKDLVKKQNIENLF